eukprot:gene3526-biopygen6732
MDSRDTRDLSPLVNAMDSRDTRECFPIGECYRQPRYTWTPSRSTGLLIYQFLPGWSSRLSSHVYFDLVRAVVESDCRVACISAWLELSTVESVPDRCIFLTCILRRRRRTQEKDSGPKKEEDSGAKKKTADPRRRQRTQEEDSGPKKKTADPRSQRTQDRVTTLPRSQRTPNRAQEDMFPHCTGGHGVVHCWVDGTYPTRAQASALKSLGIVDNAFYMEGDAPSVIMRFTWRTRPYPGGNPHPLPHRAAAGTSDGAAVDRGESNVKWRMVRPRRRLQSGDGTAGKTIQITVQRRRSCCILGNSETKQNPAVREMMMGATLGWNWLLEMSLQMPHKQSPAGEQRLGQAYFRTCEQPPPPHPCAKHAAFFAERTSRAHFGYFFLLFGCTNHMFPGALRAPGFPRSPLDCTTKNTPERGATPPHGFCSIAGVPGVWPRKQLVVVLWEHHECHFHLPPPPTQPASARAAASHAAASHRPAPARCGRSLRCCPATFRYARALLRLQYSNMSRKNRDSAQIRPSFFIWVCQLFVDMLLYPWEKRQRTRTGRGCTIESNETDADDAGRARVWPFLPGARAPPTSYFVNYYASCAPCMCLLPSLIRALPPAARETWPRTLAGRVPHDRIGRNRCVLDASPAVSPRSDGRARRQSPPASSRGREQNASFRKHSLMDCVAWHQPWIVPNLAGESSPSLLHLEATAVIVICPCRSPQRRRRQETREQAKKWTNKIPRRQMLSVHLAPQAPGTQRTSLAWRTKKMETKPKAPQMQVLQQAPLYPVDPGGAFGDVLLYILCCAASAVLLFQNPCRDHDNTLTMPSGSSVQVRADSKGCQIFGFPRKLTEEC